MDEEEDLDIAAAMGFGSFGGTKKRKFDQTNSPKAKADVSGANSTQLGVRTKKSAIHEETDSNLARVKEGGSSVDLPGDVQAENQESSRPSHRGPEEMISFGGSPLSRAELNALKFGVTNANGDTAYFLPSFVEDPWEKLTKSGS
jgi:hypothetical protein